VNVERKRKIISDSIPSASEEWIREGTRAMKRGDEIPVV
jgi:hypothetical protein